MVQVVSEKVASRNCPVIAGTVIFCIIVQYVFLLLAPCFHSFESLNYSFVRSSIEDRISDAEFVCMGDSLVMYSIAPDIMERLTGGRFYNCAVGGSGAASSYFVLSKVLQKAKKIKGIIIDFEPSILKAPPNRMAHESAELLSPLDCLDLAIHTHDFDFSVSSLLAVCFPSYRYRYGILKQLRKFAHFETDTDKTADAITYGRASTGLDGILKNWSNNRGHLDAPPAPDPPQDWHQIISQRVPWNCNSVNESYLRRLLTLARQKNVTVYWLLPPLRQGAQKEVEALGLDQAYDQFVNGVRKDYPETIVLDARHIHYPEEDFITGCHLNRLGASDFSTTLGNWLAKNSAATKAEKWITFFPGQRNLASKDALAIRL